MPALTPSAKSAWPTAPRTTAGVRRLRSGAKANRKPCRCPPAICPLDPTIELARRDCGYEREECELPQRHGARIGDKRLKPRDDRGGTMRIMAGGEEPYVREHPAGNHRVVREDQKSGDATGPADDVPPRRVAKRRGDGPGRGLRRAPRPAAQRDFANEYRRAECEAGQHEHRDEDESAVRTGEIREPPDAAQTDCGTDGAEQQSQAR